MLVGNGRTRPDFSLIHVNFYGNKFGNILIMNLLQKISLVLELQYIFKCFQASQKWTFNYEKNIKPIKGDNVFSINCVRTWSPKYVKGPLSKISSSLPTLASMRPSMISIKKSIGFPFCYIFIVFNIDRKTFIF